MLASLEPRTSRGVTLALTAAALLSSVPPAYAQESEEERTAAARALFEEGMRFVADGQLRDAADRLRRSYSLRASPIVAFNLSTALIELGELVGASEHLRTIVRDEDAPEVVRATARERLDALLPRLAELVVRVEGPMDGVEVRVDEVALDEALIGVARPIDPGVRLVAALREHAEVARERVELAPGGHAEVTLSIPPLPALAMDVEESAETRVAASLLVHEPPPPPPGTDIGLIVLFTGVGAAAVGGIVLAVVLAGALGPQPIEGDFDPPLVRWRWDE